MADRHDHARTRQAFDERQGALLLRGERHEANASAGGVLPATELVPVGAADVFAGMRATWAVLRGDIWPLKVERGDGASQVAVRVARPGQCGETVRESGRAAGDQCRTKAAGAVSATHLGDAADLVGRQSLRVET